MLQFIKNKNIFNIDAKYLVNPVNCVGVMGKGLALEFKKKYPKMFYTYKLYCNNRKINPGHITFIADGDHVIVLFPTKRHWRDRSKKEDIDNGLKDLSEQIDIILATGNNFTIAIPRIGCGLGGLNWECQVKPLINERLKKYADNERVEIIVLE